MSGFVCKIRLRLSSICRTGPRPRPGPDSPFTPRSHEESPHAEPTGRPSRDRAGAGLQGAGDRAGLRGGLAALHRLVRQPGSHAASGGADGDRRLPGRARARGRRGRAAQDLHAAAADGGGGRLPYRQLPPQPLQVAGGAGDLARHPPGGRLEQEPRRAGDHLGAAAARRHLRDRAMLLLGFAALLRRSEVVALDVSDLVLVREGLEVRVAHEADRGQRDPEPRVDVRAVPYGEHAQTCPVRAWLAWRSATGLDEGPAFRPVHPRARAGHYPTATIQHAGAAVQAGPVATDQELMEAGGWASLEVVRSYTGSTRIWEDPVAGRLGL